MEPPHADTPWTFWLAWLDVIGVPVYIAWVIWLRPPERSLAWIGWPIWMGISFLVQHDTPGTLGWRVDNLWVATRRASWVLGGMALALTAISFAEGSRIARYATRFSPRHLLGYLAFCLLQQVTLNSLMTNRLVSLLRRPWAAILLASAIFAALHWPNPVLVSATLLAGGVMTWLFWRERNILPLAVWQAILGTLLTLAVPRAWLHNMRVGPGYYRWRR
jgi:Type II CAAX prenyl endopeptidase Rce1-like